MSWSIKRIKDVAKINCLSLSNNIDSDYMFKYVDIGNVSQNGIIEEPELMKFSESPSRARRIVKKNDVIVSTVRTYLKAIAYFEDDVKDTIVSTGFAVLTSESNIIPKYLAYKIQSESFIDKIIINSKGVSYPAINSSQINDLEIELTTLREQTQIATYLDAKTTAIDKKVFLLQQKIKHYKAYRKTVINETVTKGIDKTVKLKDSGINWIGEIPKHWEVKRFKEICYKNHTGGTPSTSNTEMFRGDNVWVTIADIKKEKLVYDSKLKLTNEAIISSNIPLTPKGSLMYSFKLTLGKIAFAKKDIYTNEAIISVLPNKNIVLNYHYYMLPIYLLLNATENIYGAKMLNQKLINNSLLLNPPIKEQKQIADYLDTKTTAIDKIVKNIEAQITTLKELRKTLINEVVTGKVKVSA